MAEFESLHLAYGRHVLVDIADTSADLLNDGDALVLALSRAVKAEGATVLGTITHAFEPVGVTVLLLLSESHVSLHTYPREGRAFFDAFTCGVRCEPMNIFQRFADESAVGSYRIIRCERGESVTRPSGATLTHTNPLIRGMRI
ncbi:adenosylmethionine decarboxylase [Trinickia dabaoshanensis]|uniref:Adenosylmethionine decarboxylase n=1 Tax=Trinickia dabaoshanensis TaxID=564714 RepID=A0A2N7VSD0_9BURK|nr:adenosylmethionine decarboxylase [Trinickia dabaoshanensis]PMS20061.1 adenosylmethionine decarboxylase [Trinickia dabaoshanensis]